MNYNRITFGPVIDGYLANKDPEKTRAFLDGLQKAGEIIEALSVDDFMDVAQKRGTLQAQDFIPLFVKAARERETRQYRDAEAMLSYCDLPDPRQFLAFLLDVPALDDRGRAVTEAGEPLEDDHRQPLPSKVNPGWANCKISNYEDDTIISREDYFALDESERLNYGYHRYFDLTKDGVPVMTITDSKRHIIGLLLQAIIRMDDGPINERLYTKCFCDEDLDSDDSLYAYRDLVLETMAEVASSYEGRREIKTSGELLLAQIEQFVDLPDGAAQLEYACTQVGAEALECWCGVIDACYQGDDEGLADYVTDMDIINYRDKNNQPFLVHGFAATNPLNWKTSFKNVFVPTTARRLVGLLEYAYEEFDGDTDKIPSRCIRALEWVRDCLVECGYVEFDEEEPEDDSGETNSEPEMADVAEAVTESKKKAVKPAPKNAGATSEKPKSATKKRK